MRVEYPGAGVKERAPISVMRPENLHRVGPETINAITMIQDHPLESVTSLNNSRGYFESR
jgi:hypothetical protein